MNFVRYKGRYYICHASVEDSWEAQSYFDKEKSIAFLEKLKEHESFEYEIPEDFEPQKERQETNPRSYIKIKLKNYDYSYVVIMGTLIKALNEHRKWAYDAMMSDKPYFPEAEKNIRKILANSKGSMSVVGGHQYIPTKYNYPEGTAEPYKMAYKRRTIRGVMRLHKKLGPQQRGIGTIWATYMGSSVL